MDADKFLVFSDKDRLHSSLCFGEEETREIVSCFTGHVRVWRVTPDELTRDVTDEFLPPEPVSVYAGFDPDREYDWRIA